MIEWKRLYAKPAGSLPGGVVTQWGVGAITVFILLFLTYWIFFEGGKPAEVAGLTDGSHNPAPQLYSADDSASRRRNHAGRNQQGGGGAGGGASFARRAGGATTASPTSRNYCRQPSGDPCRAESRQRTTLHAARMGTSGTLAPRSRRAAQPFASQFAGRSELPQTGQRRRRRARANCRQPRTPKR